MNKTFLKWWHYVFLKFDIVISPFFPIILLYTVVLSNTWCTRKVENPYICVITDEKPPKKHIYSQKSLTNMIFLKSLFCQLSVSATINWMKLFAFQIYGKKCTPSCACHVREKSKPSVKKSYIENGMGLSKYKHIAIVAMYLGYKSYMLNFWTDIVFSDITFFCNACPGHKSLSACCKGLTQ